MPPPLLEVRHFAEMKLMVLGVLVCGCAADTFGRMTVRPGGAVRNAEACYTSAGSSSVDRLQGRQQEMTTNGLRLEWAQQTELMGRQLSLGLKAVGTSEHAGVTELKLGSSTLDLGIVDLSGDCTHDFERRSTQLDLTMTSAGTVYAASCDLRHGLQEVSAYHRAGPINLQPRWLRPAKLLRLHVGRGGAFRRCPVSMQLDLPLPGADPAASPELELKVRGQLGPARMLRFVWLATQGAAILELTEMAADPDATWIARAHASYRMDGGRFRVDRPELTLKRKWRW